MKTLAEENADLKAELETAKTGNQAAIDAAVSAATAPLNSQISTLTGERDAALGQVTAEKSAHKITTDSLATANASIASKDAEIATLKKNDKTASQKAIEIAASQGVKPIEGNKKSDDLEAQSMSRAEFNALQPAQQMEFSKKGGKLTN